MKFGLHKRAGPALKGAGLEAVPRYGISRSILTVPAVSLFFLVADILIEAELGETFYVRSRKEPFYVVRSEIWMDLTSTGMEKMVIPAGFRIDIRPGDRAVYIGTIRYHRDEFFSVEKVEVIDDYRKGSSAFRKKFDESCYVRRILLCQVCNCGV